MRTEAPKATHVIPRGSGSCNSERLFEKHGHEPDEFGAGSVGTGIRGEPRPRVDRHPLSHSRPKLHRSPPCPSGGSFRAASPNGSIRTHPSRFSCVNSPRARTVFIGERDLRERTSFRAHPLPRTGADHGRSAPSRSVLPGAASCGSCVHPVATGGHAYPASNRAPRKTSVGDGAPHATLLYIVATTTGRLSRAATLARLRISSRGSPPALNPRQPFPYHAVYHPITPRNKTP